MEKLVLLQDSCKVLDLDLRPVLGVESGAVVCRLRFQNHKTVLARLASDAVHVLLELGETIVRQAAAFHHNQQRGVSAVQEIVIVEALRSPGPIYGKDGTNPPDLAVCCGPDGELDYFVGAALELELGDVLSARRVHDSRVSELLVVDRLAVDGLLILAELPHAVLGVVPVEIRHLDARVQPPALFHAGGVLDELKLNDVPIHVPDDLCVGAAVGFPGLHDVLKELVALLLHVEHLDDLHRPVPLCFHLRGFVRVCKVVFVPDVNSESGDV